MEGSLLERVAIQSAFASVFALLCCVFVSAPVHVWTEPFARTQLSYKTHVVPKSGAFFIAPVAITTIVRV